MELSETLKEHKQNLIRKILLLHEVKLYKEYVKISPF